MKELIEELKKENQNILHKNPKVAIEFDWSSDAYRLQYNEEMIGKLKKLIISDVVVPKGTFYCDSKKCNDSKGDLCNGYCKGVAETPPK